MKPEEHVGLYKDEIVDKVRKIRHAYAAKFNFDLGKIFKDLSRKEKTLKGFKVISLVSKNRKVTASI
ncbi:MAG: hypothetical protein JNL74_10820 [Fibrobacteres bacterium]|nr:hypothetical protein [Fibrobacterota bacterium]